MLMVPGTTFQQPEGYMEVSHNLILLSLIETCDFSFLIDSAFATFNFLFHVGVATAGSAAALGRVEADMRCKALCFTGFELTELFFILHIVYIITYSIIKMRAR